MFDTDGFPFNMNVFSISMYDMHMAQAISLTFMTPFTKYLMVHIDNWRRLELRVKCGPQVRLGEWHLTVSRAGWSVSPNSEVSVKCHWPYSMTRSD